jgi:hypothetical protein
MMENLQSYAPVAIFVFKRPQHLQGTLESLSANPELKSSPLYVFSDQGRNAEEQSKVDEVRQIVRDFAHPNKILVEAQQNRGLADSIIGGVTQLCEKFGQVIVVEDDLIVSPFFLNYMNTALNRYALEKQVMQISGHMFPVALKVDTDAIFLPFTTSWGWATWQRAWCNMKIEPEVALVKLKSRAWRFRFDIGGSFPYARMLADRLAGKNNSWAIWWYFQVFLRGGFVLYPAISLVNNDGFDGSGTHCGAKDIVKMQFNELPISKYPVVSCNDADCRKLSSFFRGDRGIAKNVYDFLWRIFYRV